VDSGPLCGDSSKPEDLDRLFEGATIQLVELEARWLLLREPQPPGVLFEAIRRREEIR
jgi:hypothetical protein